MHDLEDRYAKVRALTEILAEPLSAEDQTVQSMPDVSPTKWHRAHTSWFFETFILSPRDIPPFNPQWGYLFNSYYEAVGPRYRRDRRGIITRPGIAEIATYRRQVDDSMASIFPTEDPLVELGINHEQQHQELLLMDIKHVLSEHPNHPVAYPSDPPAAESSEVLGWRAHQGGPVQIGHDGVGFAFDNEGPRHDALVPPFALADRTVTCGEYQQFIDDGGYATPELWLADGWAHVQAEGWDAPLYWSDGGVFTLHGLREIDPDAPVSHVSLYEADAFAHWSGYRLPTETEWEAIAAAPTGRPPGRFDTRHLEPERAGPFGEVWEWTSSSYSPYPGFRAPPGAVGEYNGKFMVNQYVLRGGSSFTPDGHLRATYRNFFPAGARWVVAGIRLARDL